jgi:hypothetical protein
MPPMVALATAMNSSAAQSLAQGAQDASPFVQTAGSEGLSDSGAPLVVDPEKKHWVEIKLVDQGGKPIPDEMYHIELPDGSAVDGTLDANGQARVDGIDPGSCKITFPSLDKKSWDKK